MRAFCRDIVGGSEKRGYSGGQERTSGAVTRWPNPVPAGRRTIESSGGVAFRGVRLVSAVGLAFDLQDDRSLDQTIEKSHRERTIRQVLSPFLEVDVGHQRRGALLIA